MRELKLKMTSQKWQHAPEEKDRRKVCGPFTKIDHI